MKLHSQEVRALAPENDPLKIGMGWSVGDLSKPQIMMESTFGDSHPLISLRPEEVFPKVGALGRLGQSLVK